MASLVVLVVSSLVVVGVSILDILDLIPSENDVIVSGSSVLFSVFIFVVSIVFFMNDFSARSFKMYSCGIEINRLKMRIFQELQGGREDGIFLFNYYRLKYEEILDRYENHKYVDHAWTKFTWPQEYKNNRAWIFVKVIALLIFEFSVYMIVLMVSLLWIFFVIKVVM
ncbi:hypothetical protein A167_00346 [Alcanivorax sp. S71-1-4]|nr:hypothetical protein A167_00346 [Alcanivorax sp. S71-1-4]